MRILGLSNLLPSPRFPLRGVFNKQLFCALAKDDQVRLIVPISWTDELRSRRRGKADSPGIRRDEIEGIRTEFPRYVFTPKLLRGTYGHCFKRSVSAAFSRAMEELRPEVVLAAWGYPDGWAAVKLAHRHGIPAVVKLHGSDVLVQSKIRACRSRLCECLKDADAVIAVSQDLADKAIELGASPDRVKTVYDGVNRDIFHPGDRLEARRSLGLAAEERILLFVGNLVHVKGIDVLLDACKRLSDGGEEFRCHLAGDGPLRAELQNRVDALGLERVVRFIGPVRHSDLANWYRAANVFVLPSRSEGVPCVLLEAAACQTPFVASRVGGIPEIAGWGASRLVQPEDPVALADAISQSLADKVPLQAVSAFTRSFDDVAAEVRSILRPLVGGPGEPTSASIRRNPVACRT